MYPMGALVMDVDALQQCTGGVHGERHLGELPFYHIVCIHSIPAPAIAQTANEAPAGPGSVWIIVV